MRERVDEPSGGRETCARCRRPTQLCWCAHLVSLETKTRVVLLQHPRERDMSIGTARMASLCLPNAELHVGTDWSQSAALARALSDPARPAALLYPGEGAIDVDACPPAGPITLVVVDGTWSHAKKLVRQNPVLAALPRYAFRPTAPSEYRIRREPDEGFVSTLEALVHVLGVLEGDPARFRAMLAPFRAMIDTQIAFRAQKGSQRYRAKAGRIESPYAILRRRRDALVCLVAEANAWARGTGPEGASHVPELVQLAACRLSTGETFDVVVAPERPLAPGTAVQTRLSVETLQSGVTRRELVDRWRAFVREGDVICAWGLYGVKVVELAGASVPPGPIDLRSIARKHERSRVGMPRDYFDSLRARSAEPMELGPPLARGRAGERLAELCAITRLLSRD
jgi:DTW domain-containing protein YfiP